MAHIKRVPGARHLRSEPSVHILHYHKGNLVRSGRGLAFWFVPLSASIAEIPCDDRELPFLFHGRSNDFQDVTAQGVVTYRVVDPERLARRIDFSIDLRHGTYLKEPLEQITQTVTKSSQQLAWDYIAHADVRTILGSGTEEIRQRLREGLVESSILEGLGLEIVGVLVSNVAPTAEVEKALQTPTRETIQQQADEATFERRALAVEKERAIQENELANQIELARREETLIGQRGTNEQRRAREEATAGKIAAEAAADRNRLAARARSDAIRAIEAARVDSEKDRMALYRDLPSSIMLSLAARELAGKLRRIDHLSLSPDGIAPLLQTLIQAGTRRLENDGDDRAPSEA
jgi:regulator of protease activity HflC (stomatin/prohibitin superfamily)